MRQEEPTALKWMRRIREYAVMHVKLLLSEAFFQPKMKKYCWTAGPGPAGEQLEHFPRPPSWIKFSQGEAYPELALKG